MAHPNKAEGIRGHNAKLRRMTRDYGDANPNMKREARVNFPKYDGPEEDPGFGSDEAGATSRSDRPAPRAAPGNAVATLKRGGSVRKRAAGGPVGLSKPKGRGKGKTSVSININPAAAPPPVSGPSLGANPAMPAPPVVPPKPPMMPPGAGMPVPPPGAGALPPGVPGGMPPGGPGIPPGPLGQLALQQRAAGLLPRKRGGRIPHDDEAADKKLVNAMVKESALKGRRRGGSILKGKGAESGEGRLNRNRAMGYPASRARGGKVLEGKGAESGEGRLARNHSMDHKLKPESPEKVA